MNDYLAHLAARVLAPEPAIRPRALSLFEPAPAGSAAPGEPAMETRGADRGDASAVDSPLEVKAKAEQPVRAQGDVRGERSREREMGSESARRIQNSELPDPEIRVELPTSKVAILPAAVPVASIVPLPVAPPDREADRPLKNGARSAASPDAHERANAAPEPVRPRIAAAEDRAPAAIEAAPIAPIFPTPTTRSQTPESAALVAAPLRLPAQRAMGTAPAENPPPVIHVTIGRLEIRAIVPPAAAPRAHPKRADASSLEDYLRKRSGGAAR